MNIGIPDNPNPPPNYMHSVIFANPLNLDANDSNAFYCHITGNTTLNILNSRVGAAYSIELEMDGVGGHVITLGASFTSEIVGSGTINTTASSISRISVTVAEDESFMYNIDVFVKTFYWNFPGVGFTSLYPDTDDMSYDSSGWAEANADGISLRCPVTLPDGVTITAAFIAGNATAGDETWTLKRLHMGTGAVDDLATGNINIPDLTISNPVVDNATYAYFFITSSIDTNDRVYGSIISYTI